MLTYRVKFETDRDSGKICAEIPTLNHVADYGRTVEEALKNLRVLAESVLEYFRHERRSIPASDEVKPGELYLCFDVGEQAKKMRARKRKGLTAAV